MPCLAQSSAYDSDASYSPEDDDVKDGLFDHDDDEHSALDTEPMDVEDLSVDDKDACEDVVDLDDQV